MHAYEIASANVEFDPDRYKLRPGSKPEETASAAKRGVEQAPLPSAPSPAERGYGPEAAKAVLDDIRKAILEDTRTMGRRLTVDEALERYGDYGVEAKEVIASMTEKGLIQRRAPAATEAPKAAQSDIASDIGRAVEGIARVIEQSVGDWQKAGGHGSRARDGSHGSRASEYGRRAERTASRIADKIDRQMERAGVHDEKRALKAEFKRHASEVGTGKWDAELYGSDAFNPGAEELETDFTRYRDKIEAKASKSGAGFVGNLLSFAGVNALLWYINLNLAPGFMWAAIVSAGWGTGVVSGFFAMIRSKAKASEIDRIPELDPAALDVYKKISRVKDGMAMHFASVVSVPALLFTINLLTSPGFLWAAIPSGIMALSFLGHLLSYPGTLRGLEKKLWRMLGVDSWRELFRMGKTRRTSKAAGSYGSIYAEVSAIRDDIVRDLKAGKGSSEFGKDMIPTLDRYVEQVKMLSRSVNEIDGIVSTIPVAELRRDRESLEAKRADAGSQALKDEYGRSIEEIARQEKACKDLEDQSELLRLRLGSSANALKQLKLDMARMKALPEAGERQALEDIRKKAGELSSYLDDLKTGYAESLADPYAELERLAAEADARAKLPGAGDGPGER